MTIAVDMGRKATKTNKQTNMSMLISELLPLPYYLAKAIGHFVKLTSNLTSGVGLKCETMKLFGSIEVNRHQIVGTLSREHIRFWEF